MRRRQSVTATFNAAAPVTYTLTVAKAGTGTRNRHLLPRRHQLRRRLLRALQLSGTVVTLDPTAAAAGSTFSGWSGASAPEPAPARSP